MYRSTIVCTRSNGFDRKDAKGTNVCRWSCCFVLPVPSAPQQLKPCQWMNWQPVLHVLLQLFALPNLQGSEALWCKKFPLDQKGVSIEMQKVQTALNEIQSRMQKPERLGTSRTKVLLPKTGLHQMWDFPLYSINFCSHYLLWARTCPTWRSLSEVRQQSQNFICPSKTNISSRRMRIYREF